MRVLVTGAAGFIGYHVCKRLLQSGCKVLGYDSINEYYDPFYKHMRLGMLKNYDSFEFRKNDIKKLPDLRKAWSDFEPSHVVHLAAQAGVRHSIKNPYDYINSNIVGFQNILECIREFDVKNFVYASSSSVYGGNPTPFSEMHKTDNPLSLYAASKKANELFANSYGNLYGIPNTGLRFFTVYGPHGRPDMAMFKFADAMRRGTEIELYNEGKMGRDFTYVDDIVFGILAALNKPQVNKIYNLANGNTESLMDVVDNLKKQLNYDKNFNIKFMPMQLGDVKSSLGDIEAARKELNYHPVVGLELGIKYFCSWFRKVHPDVIG